MTKPDPQTSGKAETKKSGASAATDPVSRVDAPPPAPDAQPVPAETKAEGRSSVPVSGKSGIAATAKPAQPPKTATGSTGSATADQAPASGPTGADKAVADKAAAKPMADKAGSPTPTPAATAPKAAEPAGTGFANAPKPSQPAPAPIPTRGGFWPLALGGAVAAGLGAFAMYAVLPALPEAWRPAQTEAPQIDADAIRADAVQAAQAAADQAAAGAEEQIATASARLDAAQAEIGALRDEIEALKSAPAGTATGDNGAAIAELRQFIQAQAAEIQAQGGRIQELAQRPMPDGTQAFAALRTEAQSIVADLRTQAEGIVGDVRAQAQDAGQQIAAARTQAQALMAEAESAARRAQGQGALASLQAAIQTGAPVAAPVAALNEAGVSVPQAIASGQVPQLDNLRAGFPDAARSALAAATQAEAEGQGMMSRFGSFLKVQTGARTVGGPREGTDPDAVLSRAEAALASGDVAGSLAEVAALPAAGREAMADWVAQAQAWVAAQEAVAQMAETLN